LIPEPNYMGRLSKTSRKRKKSLNPETKVKKEYKCNLSVLDALDSPSEERAKVKKKGVSRGIRPKPMGGTPRP